MSWSILVSLRRTPGASGHFSARCPVVAARPLIRDARLRRGTARLRCAAPAGAEPQAANCWAPPAPPVRRGRLLHASPATSPMRRSALEAMAPSSARRLSGPRPGAERRRLCPAHRAEATPSGTSTCHIPPDVPTTPSTSRSPPDGRPLRVPGRAATSSRPRAGRAERGTETAAAHHPPDPGFLRNTSPTTRRSAHPPSGARLPRVKARGGGGVFSAACLF